MFTIHKESTKWCGETLTLETGRMARQADGAVFVQYGGTEVLCTATAARSPRTGIDFLPLSVHYQEKTFSAGKIPGGFFKREGRPSEKETLTSRLIDRPVRPLFPEQYAYETQIICTVLSHDLKNDPDIPAMVGASAALAISGLPFLGPIGGARVGFINGAFVLNPAMDSLEESALDLVVAGTDQGVMMVESEASELSEAQMLEAVQKGHEAAREAIALIEKLVKKAGKPPMEIAEKPAEALKIAKETEKTWGKKIAAAYQITEKKERSLALESLRNEALAEIDPDGPEHAWTKSALKAAEKSIVRKAILESSTRIDGRKTDDIRTIACETGLLARTHGSSLFTRGETQALVAATLGTVQDRQIIDALEGEFRQRFMLHYNFPPFSVGEVSMMRPPGRREIGHGKLAWRALRPLVPDEDSFPYTIRLVSEVTESNGSSSMATVCGCSMALMDAGAPLKDACAGIAMGLIKEGDQFAILSDILGDEDHLGDMDFKVAGTETGITALQMDIKIPSITAEIMEKALAQARDGRLHILKEMQKSISAPSETVSPFAPVMETIRIPTDKIRDVIGSGGKVIRALCEETGAKIDVADDGTIQIAAIGRDAIDDALKRIRNLTDDPEVGKLYRGTVVKIADFGAFVNFLGPRDGLVHISELTDGRVGSVSDVVSEGDSVHVKCLEIDDRGKVRLSMRVVDQETGEDISDSLPEPYRRPPRRSSGGDRDRDRDRDRNGGRPRRRGPRF